MFIRITFLTLLLLLLPLSSRASAQQLDDFLQRAIPLARLGQRETGVPASVTIAQAIWETGRGTSPINDANNYFGIKASGTDDDTVNVGPVASGWVWAWTKEWDGTRYISKRERFRKYLSMQDSFRDHGLLLSTLPRYAPAMQVVEDAREFVRRMAAAGYATSPTYAGDLIELMDAENLYQYDLVRDALEPQGQSVPLDVNAGDIFQIYFDVKNTGFGTWSPNAGYYLASANENRFNAAPKQLLDQLVPPERVKRWALTLIAPPDTGTYTTRWQMKHGEQNFGEPLTFQVHVHAAPTTPLWIYVAGVCLLLLVGAGLIVGYWANKKGKPIIRA